MAPTESLRQPLGSILMMPFASTFPIAVQKGLYFVVQGAFMLYALFSFIVVARYTARKVRAHRLVDGRAAPKSFAIPPAGPWILAFNIIALPFVPSVVYAAVIGALLLVVVVVDQRVLPNRGILAQAGPWLFVVNILALLFVQSWFYMVLIVMTLSVLLVESGRVAREQFGLERLSGGQLVKWSLLIFGAVIVVVSPLTQLYELALNYLPYSHPEQQSVEIFRQLEKPNQILAFFIDAVLIAPLLEELFFRGFLQTLLKKYVSTWMAVILTGAIFGCAHLNLESFAALWVLGIVLGVAYEHTGSILLPIGIHACFNLTTGLSLLAEKVNPG